MAKQVIIPKLGMTMQEGTLTEWLVESGSPVSVGDALFALSTDKVEVEVEADVAGVLVQVAASGATLAPGSVVGWLLAAGEPIPGEPVPGESVPSEPVPAEPARLFSSPNARRLAAEHGITLEGLVGSGPSGRIVAADVLAAVPAVAVPAPATASSPLVRKYAQSRGIDPQTVVGSGPGGRLRRSDIDQSVLDSGSSTTPSDSVRSTRPTERIVPFTGMRGVIARRMHASLTEMAQLTHGFEVEMDAVVHLRRQLKDELPDSELSSASLNDFVVRAAALALRDHPLLNARVEADGIHLLSTIDVGLAVSVPDGLLAPVIRNADQRPLAELASITRELAEAARNGSLPLAALEGSSFTVTSLGTYGVDMFTPIVNPGNVAILGVGRLREGVRWEHDHPIRTQVLTLSLSFDHRAVDGAPAAEYLQTLHGLLRQPLRLLF